MGIEIQETDKNRRILDTIEELGILLGFGKDEPVLLGDVDQVLASALAELRKEREARHEKQKTTAIMVELAKEVGVIKGGTLFHGDIPRTLSLALDIVRKTTRPARQGETLDRLRKILEKTDAIRDDIAATIRIGA